MPKALREKKVVIVLTGRYAGKKAVVLKTFDEGSTQRPFGHALVAGVERTPLKVTKTMGKKLVAKRSRLKPFIKVVNYNHLMPTRYALDVDIDKKEVVTMNNLKDREKRWAAKKEVKSKFSAKYLEGGNPWFFAKLRF
eukprot:m.429072 g.429072  ORF g.429072 m.429072 type:complete len:138 (-) comp16950_c0_seq1:38-451(-)